MLPDMSFAEMCIPPGLLLAMKAPAMEQVPPPAVRLLLLPAFHSYVLLTVTGSDGVCQVEWRVAEWIASPGLIRQYTCPPPGAYSAGAELTQQVLARATELRSVPLERLCVLDGMSFVLWFRTAEESWVFSEHTYQKRIAPIVAQIVTECWNDRLEPEVNNAVAEAARYVGLQFPTKTVPERPARTKIGILGDPTDVEQVTEALRHHRGTK
jgi:hypothetical protein